MNQKFKNALEIVTDSIRNDKELRRAYQANIAMSFYDAMRCGISEPRQLLLEINTDSHQSWIKIHKISNQAADNFLNLWLKPTLHKK